MSHNKCLSGKTQNIFTVVILNSNMSPTVFKLRQFKFYMHTKMSDEFIKAFILCILQGKPNIQFYFIELS